MKSGVVVLVAILSRNFVSRLESDSVMLYPLDPKSKSSVNFQWIAVDAGYID